MTSSRARIWSARTTILGSSSASRNKSHYDILVRQSIVQSAKPTLLVTVFANFLIVAVSAMLHNKAVYISITRMASWLRVRSCDRLKQGVVRPGELVTRVCVLGVDPALTDTLRLGLKGDESRFLGDCLAYVMYIARDLKDSAEGCGVRTVLKASRK